MELRYWVMIGLFLLAALLPALGLWRVYRKATQRFVTFSAVPPSDEGDGASFAHLDLMIASWFESQKRGPAVAVSDAGLVGAGLLCGAVASVWAVVDTALA